MPYDTLLIAAGVFVLFFLGWLSPELFRWLWLADQDRHQRRVGRMLRVIAKELEHRQYMHDRSSYEAPERLIVARNKRLLFNRSVGKSTTLMKGATELLHAVSTHYKKNRHHPEHWSNGVWDMTLVDVIEMVCDWRSTGCNIEDRLTKYHIDGPLADVIRSTNRMLEQHDKRR